MSILPSWVNYNHYTWFLQWVACFWIAPLPLVTIWTYSLLGFLLDKSSHPRSTFALMLFVFLASLQTLGAHSNLSILESTFVSHWGLLFLLLLCVSQISWNLHILSVVWLAIICHLYNPLVSYDLSVAANLSIWSAIRASNNSFATTVTKVTL
jgi:hypothetical protein